MSTTTSNLGLFKYDTTNPTDLASAFNINTALNNNWDKIDEAISNSGGARNIGEIVASTLPLEDAGLHLLDGALIDGSGIYSEFVQYIANLYSNNPTANYFTDETTWQDNVTNYGVCGKFVYDATANTVRLPKVTGILEGTTDVTALGDLVEAGLPNITGTFSGGAYGSDIASGAFSTLGTRLKSDSGGTAYKDNVEWFFDASLSSSIYDNSTTVQPQTIKVLYYIVIATSTKTDIQVDIDEIATDLNGKADTDLSNVPSSKGILTESYVNGTSWYRVYSDGWCEQGGVNTVSSTSTVASLLKNYINNNYSVMTQGYRDTYNSNTTTNIQILSKSNSQINMACSTTTLSIEWQACGYIR